MKTVCRTVFLPGPYPQTWGQPSQSAPGCATGSCDHGMLCNIHKGIVTDTLEVQAVGLTSNRIMDAPVLPDLLAQFPA